MNALEARVEANKFNNEKNKKVYQIIKSNIFNAAKDGDFSVTFFNLTLNIETKDILEEEGFIITNSQSGTNETATKISW